VSTTVPAYTERVDKLLWFLILTPYLIEHQIVQHIQQHCWLGHNARKLWSSISLKLKGCAFLKPEFWGKKLEKMARILLYYVIIKE